MHVPACMPLKLQRLLLLGGPVLFLLGLLVTPALDDLRGRPLRQTLVLLLLPVLLSALAAKPLRLRLANALALLWAAPLLVFAGAGPVLATLVLCLAAIALGGRIAPARAAPLQLALGLVLLAGAVGWLLPLPVHHAAAYWPALLALLAWRWRPVLASLQQLHAGWRDAVDAAPRSAAWAVASVGLLSTAAWLPTLAYDDLAYHLALPAQLEQLGYYRLDVRSQSWALAPWSPDVLHAIVQVMAGAEGRGALNMAWVLLVAAGGFQATQAIGGDRAAAFATVALAASVPMMAWLVGGMQVELPAAALGLVLAAVLATRAAGAADGGPVASRDLPALAVLAGGLVATKASLVLMLFPLGLWWLWQVRARLPWRALPGGAMLAVFAGGSSYAYAVAIAGNPLLPLFNDWFPNDYAAGRMIDSRWLAGLSWDIPWRMAFESPRYDEGFAGSAGFLLVLLAGPWLLALLRPGPARTLAWVSLVAGLLPLLFIQYARYVLPAMLLGLPALVATCRSLGGVRAGTALLALAWGANVAFFANGSWIWRTGAPLQVFQPREAARQALWLEYAPERAWGPLLRGQAGARLLVLSPSPAVAEFGGRAFSPSRYDPALQEAATRAAGSAEAWRRLLLDHGFTHVSLREAGDPALAAALVQLGARREAVSGDAQLWRLPPGPGARDLMRERDVAARWRASVLAR